MNNNNGKTEILDRQNLETQIRERSIKHAWLASTVGVSEKTLTRWLNGEVSRIRINNLNKLADALDCDTKTLVASSETDTFPSTRNRDVLVNELNNDNLLFELLVSSKIKLVISLIKSTFHSALPNSIVSNFFIKLGYASLMHRKLKTARNYFDKGLQRAKQANNEEMAFSANLALALTYFFESDFEKCHAKLKKCSNNLSSAAQEKAHYHNTYALYYLYSGNFSACIEESNKCIDECQPGKKSIEKKLFLSSALQLSGICYLFDGDFEKAESLCKESLKVAKDSGYSRCIAASKAYLAAVYAQQNSELAEQLIAESLKTIGLKDISLPSLLCIACFISATSDNQKLLQKRSQQLLEITKPKSILSAFVHFQYYLKAKNDENIEDADERLEMAKAILIELNLPAWLDWLNQKRATNAIG